MSDWQSMTIEQLGLYLDGMAGDYERIQHYPDEIDRYRDEAEAILAELRDRADALYRRQASLRDELDRTDDDALYVESIDRDLNDIERDLTLIGQILNPSKAD